MDPILLKKWLENIGRENFYPNERSLICDAHFEKTCFYSGSLGYSHLKANAYPTIFSTSFEGLISFVQWCLFQILKI